MIRDFGLLLIGEEIPELQLIWAFRLQGDKENLWQIKSLSVGANGRSPLHFCI